MKLVFNKSLLIPAVGAVLFLLGNAGAASAQYRYNTAPAGEVASCKAYANNKYSGGGEASPVAGQTKADAFCTCMWNEAPDNVKGNLAAFADSAAGAATNKTCEAYSNWQ